MTIGTTITILDRISVATPRSRIAVFKVNGQLDAIFADTIYGKERIKTDRSLIAIFDGSMDNQSAWAVLKNGLDN